MSRRARVDKPCKERLGVEPCDTPSQFLLIHPCKCPPRHVMQRPCTSRANPRWPVQFVTFCVLEKPSHVRIGPAQPCARHSSQLTFQAPVKLFGCAYCCKQEPSPPRGLPGTIQTMEFLPGLCRGSAGNLCFVVGFSADVAITTNVFDKFAIWT